MDCIRTRHFNACLLFPPPFFFPTMSFALPARQVIFGKPAAPSYPLSQSQTIAPQPPQSQNGSQPPQLQSNNHALALPLAVASVPPPAVVPLPSLAGPSSQPTPPGPATPATLTLEQQHITAVEGIVPTLQNIVATVNLDCKLDLKTIALHARNAEYNPKVGTTRSHGLLCTPMRCCSTIAFRSCHHAHS